MGLKTKSDADEWIMTSDPLSQKYNVGCEFVWEITDDNGQFFVPNIYNMMAPYHCKCEFSFQQYLRMVEAYNNAILKEY